MVDFCRFGHNYTQLSMHCTAVCYIGHLLTQYQLVLTGVIQPTAMLVTTQKNNVEHHDSVMGRCVGTA